MRLISAFSILFSVQRTYLTLVLLAPSSEPCPRKTRLPFIRISNTSAASNFHAPHPLLLPRFGHFLMISISFPWAAPIFDGGFVFIVDIYEVQSCCCCYSCYYCCFYVRSVEQSFFSESCSCLPTLHFRRHFLLISFRKVYAYFFLATPVIVHQTYPSERIFRPFL